LAKEKLKIVFGKRNAEYSRLVWGWMELMEVLGRSDPAIQKQSVF